MPLDRQSDCLPNIERSPITDYALLLYRDDYARFREWATENSYGESATAFRELLRVVDNSQGAMEDVTALRRALASAASALDDAKHPDAAEDARTALTATGGR